VSRFYSHRICSRVTEDELRLELGRRLRARRAAQDRTLASVAIGAGLSLPYVANLENGRGNPTLSSLHGLARTLDIPLAELLREDDREVSATPAPASLRAFASGPRFRREVARMAAGAGTDPERLRDRLLDAMAAMTALPGRFDERDWQRVLDLVVLLHRDQP
jgi:transcriptional regulator with XRE-family HTH domain